MAFELTPDQDHKFDLALVLNRVDEAHKIAEAQQSNEKWRKVGDIALSRGNFTMAEDCYLKSQDFNSLLLFYGSYGDAQGLIKLVKDAKEAGKFNIAFEAAFSMGMIDECLEILVKSKRIAEASFFALAYAPSKR
jgi:coatomer subunit beta'